MNKYIRTLSFLVFLSSSAFAENCLLLDDDIIFEIKPYQRQCFLGIGQTNSIQNMSTNESDYELTLSEYSDTTTIHPGDIPLVKALFFIMAYEKSYIIRDGLKFSIFDNIDHVQNFISTK